MKKNYYILFIFIPIMLIGLFLNLGLLESVVVASIITLIANPIKIFVDKFLHKLGKKWHQKRNN